MDGEVPLYELGAPIPRFRYWNVLRAYPLVDLFDKAVGIVRVDII